MDALLLALWPAGVDLPPGLALYQRTNYNQHLTITNGFDSNVWRRLDEDSHFSNAASVANPNRLAPWVVPGGLDKVQGWTSLTACAIPGKVEVWQERVEAGARRPLPRYSWSFPVGTVFADMLLHDGTVFEIRLREKKARGWESRVAYRAEKLPPGYTGAGRCNDCHRHAGSQPGYGGSLRGSDTVFSWNPFREGAFERKP